MQLENRVAAITAGSRGIGRAIAETFLAEGAWVAINGRSEEKGRRAVAEMGGGERVLFVPGDVRRQADVEGFIATVIERFGRVDVLVNNAGGSSGFAPVAELSDEAWQDALDWTLNSTFWATRAALRDMVSREWGRIINISSVEGSRVNKPSVAHYVTCKHAVHGLTKAVALEYGPHGITSNAILPGAVETDLMKTAGPEAAAAAGISYEQFLDGYAAEAAIKRLNTAAEVAAMALLVASDVGGGITGALLDVNGGSAL
ncbi:MAG: SDR family NAD(P)-dependent oxidoreductase [Pseudomonadales bacterium]